MPILQLCYILLCLQLVQSFAPGPTFVPRHTSSAARIRPATRRPSDDIDVIEQEIIASAQARLDSKRLLELLNTAGDKEPTAGAVAQWKIAVAAGGVGSALALGATHSLVVSAVTLVILFVVANGDPLEDDSLAGALARILGRQTLTAVQASSPRVKALARAVVTGEEEIVELRNRVRELEAENGALRLWKERREKVDDALPRYSLEDLKEVARVRGIMVGGTKSQLLMRLVEAEVIEL